MMISVIGLSEYTMIQSNNNIPQTPEATIPGTSHFFNLEGFVRTLFEVPTAKPKQMKDQFVLVTNGGSSRAYIYDTVGLAWKYVALT